MKLATIAFVMAFTSTSFAAGTFTCSAEDGSSFSSIVYNGTGSVPGQIKYSIRGGAEQEGEMKLYKSSVDYSNGYATDEKVKSAVISDKKTGEIMLVIADGTLVDKTGVYSVECEFGY